MCLFVRRILPILVMLGTMAAANFTGTWKFNAAKSHGTEFAQGTLTITKTGPDTYRSVAEMITKSGEKRPLDIVRTCDGKEHPAPGKGAAKGAMLTCMVGPEGNRKLVETDNGKIAYEMTSTLSDDGKVMTQVWKWSQGEEEVRVFDRQ